MIALRVLVTESFVIGVFRMGSFCVSEKLTLAAAHAVEADGEQAGLM